MRKNGDTQVLKDPMHMPGSLSREADLDELISRQEKVAPAEGAKSRATFNTIKEIRTELKKQKLTGLERKNYVQQKGTALREEIRTALAGESEWD